jgi:putative oxidoreductase
MASFGSFIMNQDQFAGGVELVGRLLLAALFLYDGWVVINNYGATADYLAQFGVPPLLLVPALLLQVVGGLLIAAGWNARLAALALSLFCISTAVIFHTQFGDPNEAIQFWKDLAIAGGLLMLAAHGGGIFSLDSRLGKATA